MGLKRRYMRTQTFSNSKKIKKVITKKKQKCFYNQSSNGVYLFVVQLSGSEGGWGVAVMYENRQKGNIDFSYGSEGKHEMKIIIQDENKDFAKRANRKKKRGEGSGRGKCPDDGLAKEELK